MLVALVNLTATLFAAGVALRARTIQAGPAMQMPVFIILFLAPVYVPLDLLSGWVHAVAKLNPFTAMIEGGRDLDLGAGLPRPARLRHRDRARAPVLRLGRPRPAPRGGRRLGSCSLLVSAVITLILLVVLGVIQL